jgi:hypothetical protein
MMTGSGWIVRWQDLRDLVAVGLMIRWASREGEMWYAGHAMMAFADGVGKDEVVIALELFVESSGSIHSPREPAPALLLQVEYVSV